MEVISKKQQHNSPLFGGRLYENRPISFPQGSLTDAYSSLFYWANVEAIQDGEFGLHPHKGFEIMTFIFKGSLQHFDTKTNRWTTLTAGGVQVIQSGSGVQHAERYTAGSQAFQIWFDPDFSEALKHPAGYTDYQKESFTAKIDNDTTIKDYVGNDGPIKQISPDVSIKMVSIKKGGYYSSKLNSDMVYSMYLLDGQGVLNDNEVKKDDFIILDNTASLAISANERSDFFIVSSPINLNYTTQANMKNRR